MRKSLSSWLPLLASLVLVLGLVACAGDQEGNATDHDNDMAADHDGEANDGGDHAEGADNDAGHDHPDPGNRDAWSKPTEVFAFLGIAAGDVVVDLMAGGGFNSTRLAELVGSEGAVIAERGSEDLMVSVEAGEAPANIQVVGSLEAIDDARADAVIAVRAYHLFPDVPAILAEMNRVLKPGGVVGIVEVRLNEEYGHDMTSHRMGEQTVIEDMEAAGFEFVESSELLRRDDDDYTVFRAGERHMTDRMLLKFRKAE